MDNNKQIARGRGDFSSMRNEYNQGRHRLPERVFDILGDYASYQQSLILDLGCGTGIASRQLAERGGCVLGCDNDITMLALARMHGTNGIAYAAGDANHLPFKENSFEAVTAFRSLHWFANTEALRGIHHVLKKEAPFLAVTTYGTGDYSPENYRKLLQPFIENMPMNWRRELHALYEQCISESVFGYVRRIEFQTIETYTFEQALLYFQSTSIWSLVPAHSQARARAAIRTFLESNVVENRIERPIKVFVFVAIK